MPTPQVRTANPPGGKRARATPLPLQWQYVSSEVRLDTNRDHGRSTMMPLCAEGSNRSQTCDGFHNRARKLDHRLLAGLGHAI